MAEVPYDPMTIHSNDYRARTRPSAPMHSPFRYTGAKFWMRASILPLIPPSAHLIEPFAGGASVFFLRGGGPSAHLNDLDGDLITCYIHIRDRVEEMIDRLRGLPISAETHNRLKHSPPPQDELDRAASHFFLNQTSFSGITLPRTSYWSPRSPRVTHHDLWARKLRRASALLQGVRLTCCGFETVIESAPDGAFLYVDAPYLTARHHKYYRHIFEWADHERLAATLQRQRERLRWLVTYDDCTLLKDLYGWAPQIGVIRRPHSGDQGGREATGNRPPQRAVAHELLIRNFAGPSHKWSILAPRVASGSDFVALTDDQWAAVEPLLPPLPRRSDDRGRPWRDSRQVLDGILWVLSRDARWNTLPPGRYPPFQTCHRRYLRWRADGTLAVVADALRERGGPDLSNTPALSAATYGASD